MNRQKTIHMHYVFKSYLNNWSVYSNGSNKNGGIWCATNIIDSPKNRYSFNIPNTPIDPKNICCEDNIYRIPDLKDSEEKWVKTILSHISGTTEFKNFSDLFNFYNVIEDFNNLNVEKVDILKNNYPEKFYKKIEDRLFKSFRHLNEKCLNDNKQQFIHDILIQYFRTKNIRNAMQNVIKEMLVSIKDYTSSPENITYFLNIPLAEIVSKNCIKFNLTNIHIIEDKNSRIITSDQPVINTKANYYSDEVPDEIEIYYPISPNRALLINNDENEPLITSNYIEGLNIKIDRAKDNILIFGSESYRNEYMQIDKYKKVGDDTYYIKTYCVILQTI